MGNSKRFCFIFKKPLYERIVIQSDKAGFGKSDKAVIAFVYSVILNTLYKRENGKKEVINHDTIGCVYIVQAGENGPVKIGFTRNSRVNERIDSLQTGCPYEIRTLYLLTGCTRMDEQKLHIEYRDFRLKGEWFDAAVLPSLKEKLEAILHDKSKQQAVNISPLRSKYRSGN